VKRKALGRELTEKATEYYCIRVVANVLDVWRRKALRENARVGGWCGLVLGKEGVCESIGGLGGM
jgi:hypothetical protein